MKFKIYTLNDPITNEIRYVGYTGDKIEKRLSGHLSHINSRSVNTHKNRWLRKLLSSNLKPIICLVEECETEEIVKLREIEIIAEYKHKGIRLTNSTDGGEGTRGYRFSKEKIDYLTSLKIGRKVKPCSEERKLKISLANKGRKISEEKRAKMIGKFVSQETRKKLSKINLGKKMSQDTKDKMSLAREREWADGKRKSTRLGMKNSEAHKEKMRGVNNPFYGKKHSPELMEQIASKIRGKPLSEETKQKLSLALKGRVVSSETRDKIRKSISEWHKNRKNNNIIDKYGQLALFPIYKIT